MSLYTNVVLHRFDNIRAIAWKKLFHSSWKTFRTQFQYILSSLSRHKSLIENQASLLDYEQSKLDRIAAQNSFAKIVEAEKKKRLLAVTDKIRPPNSRIDQDKAEETRQAYPESGKWILRHAYLRDWMDLSCPNVPLLWVNGIPGAGILRALLPTVPSKHPLIDKLYRQDSDCFSDHRSDGGNRLARRGLLLLQA